MIRSLGPIVAGLLGAIGLGDTPPPPPPKAAPTRAEVREALRVNAARTSALTARRPHMPTTLLPRALGAGKFVHVSQEYRRHIHTGVPVLCEVGGTCRLGRNRTKRARRAGR